MTEYTDEMQQQNGHIADQLCTCGYILPSKSAIEYGHHAHYCAYYMIMKRLSQIFPIDVYKMLGVDPDEQAQVNWIE